MDTQNQESQEDLSQRLMAKEPDAVTQVARVHLPEWVNRIRADIYGLDNASGEELAWEFFEDVFLRNIDTFDASKGNLWNWARTCLKNFTIRKGKERERHRTRHVQHSVYEDNAGQLADDRGSVVDQIVEGESRESAARELAHDLDHDGAIWLMHHHARKEINLNDAPEVLLARIKDVVDDTFSQDLDSILDQIDAESSVQERVRILRDRIRKTPGALNTACYRARKRYHSGDLQP